MKRRKLTRAKTGRGPAVEVFRVRGEQPTRYAYEKKKVRHHGKLMRERLGFRGKGNVVEVAFVPVKSKSTRRGRRR